MSYNEKVLLSNYAKKIGADFQELNLGNSESTHPDKRFDAYFRYGNPSVARLPLVRYTSDYFVGMAPTGEIIHDLTLNEWADKAVADPGFCNFIEGADAQSYGANVLVLGGQKNYYHWLLNWVSKLFFLEKSGFSQDFDTILVNSNLASYQVQILESLPISKGKRIVACQYGKIIESRNALHCSVFSNPVHSKDLINWLREYLVEEGRKDFCFPKIYISRKDAPGGRRQLKNESQISSFLKRCGYKEIVLSEYTVKQQALLFKNAREVFSLHGAGLVNCIFLEPGAKVCEFQSESRFTQVFWSLGILSKVTRYDILKQRGGSADNYDDIEIPIEDVAKIIDKWKSVD